MRLPIPGDESFSVDDQGVIYDPAGVELIPRMTDGWAYPWIDLPSWRVPVPVHRVVMLAFVGPLPKGLYTRHLNGDPTDNRLENLKYGTPSENMQDSLEQGTWSNQNVGKTHCPKGHPYDEENTYLHFNKRKGWWNRQCKICNRERTRAWRAEKMRLAATMAGHNEGTTCASV